MKEAGFITAVRSKLATSVYALKLNLPYTAGVADCWYSGDRDDLWNEYKFLQTLPPVIDPKKLLSSLQQEWLLRRHKQGRNVSVTIGSPHGHVNFPGTSWLDTLTRTAFKNAAISTREIADSISSRVN